MSDAAATPARKALAATYLAACALLWLLLSFGIRGIDNDYFWHLRTGELMLLNHRWFYTDIYSWTCLGRPWFNHEWLPQVAFALLDRLGGYPLVKAAHGLLILGYLSTLALLMRCGGTPWPAAAGLATLAGFCSYGIFLPRPQAATVLGLAICAWAAYGYLAAARPAPPLWALPPLLLLWANWHGGFVLGLGWIALAGAGEWLQRHVTASGGRGREPGLLLLTLAAGLAVGLLNPNGWHAYSAAVRTLADPQLRADNAFVGEWQHPQWQQLPHLLLLLYALPPLAAWLTTARRSRWTLGLWLLPMAVLAARSIRHIPFLVIALTAVAAHHLPPALAAWQGAPPLRRSIVSLLGGVWLAAVAIMIGHEAAVKWTHGLSTRSVLPSAPALERLQRLPAGRRMFNTYGWGGILIYYLYPQQLVYIDGRHWTVYDSSNFRDYFTLLTAGPGWQQLLAAQHIDLIVALPDEPIATAARSLPGWRLYYSDGSAVIIGRP